MPTVITEETETSFEKKRDRIQSMHSLSCIDEVPEPSEIEPTESLRTSGKKVNENSQKLIETMKTFEEYVRRKFWKPMDEKT